MKKTMMVALVCGCASAALCAVNNEWLQTGTTDWNTDSNWSLGHVPTASEVAYINARTQTRMPVLNGDVSLAGLYIDNCSIAYTLAGKGTITLGAEGFFNMAYKFATVIPQDIVLNGDQTWEFRIFGGMTGGNTFLGSITGKGDLTIRAYAGNTVRHAVNLGDADHLRAPADIAIDGTLKIDEKTDVSFYLASEGPGTAFALGGTAANPNPIVLQSATPTVTFCTANPPTSDPITILNTIQVPEGGQAIKTKAAGASFAFPNDFTVGEPIGLWYGKGTGMPTFSGVWSLAQDRGATASIYEYISGYDQNNVSFGAPIADGPGIFRNPFCTVAYHNDFVFNAPAADMTYANGTVIDWCGSPYKTEIARANVNVPAGSRLGTGGVTVLPGGKLTIADTSALAPGRTIELQSSGLGLGVAAMANGLPPVSATSHGVVAVNGTLADPVDMSAIADGASFLGTTTGLTLSGAGHHPAADGVLRIGAGYGESKVITLSGKGALGADITKLQVGCPAKWQGTGYLSVTQINDDFAGDIDVAGMTFYGSKSEPTYTGSTLAYNVLNAGHALGSTEGKLALHGGIFKCQNAPVDNLDGYVKKTLAFEGRSMVYLDHNLKIHKLEVGEIVRQNRGVLHVYPGRYNGKEFFDIRDRTIMGDGVVAPAWFVESRTPTFLTHDADKGFIAYTNAATSFAGATADTVVETGATTLSEDATCYAFKNTGAIAGGKKISVGRGGIIAKENITADLDFGDHEGVIHMAAEKTITGKISGSDGLTVSGSGLTLASDNDFEGQFTVNGSKVALVLDEFDAETQTATAHGLGAATNIYINGGTLIRRDDVGKCIRASRTVTVGSSGAMINASVKSDGTTIYAKITGSGILQPFYGKVIIANPDNDYTGGTMPYSGIGSAAHGTLVATATGKLGTGDLMVHQGITATLEGNANMDPSATVHIGLGGTVEMTSDKPVIGGLIGCGTLTLGTAAASTALSVGAGGQSTAFYGAIREKSSAAPASLKKVGAGTFTLYGAHRLTGGVEVSGGALALRGEVFGDLTVDAGAALAVTIHADGGTDGARVNGDVTLAGTVDVTMEGGRKPVQGEAYKVLEYTGACDRSAAVAPPGFRLVAANGALLLKKTGGFGIIVR